MKQASSADRVFPGYGQSRKAAPSRPPHPEATGKAPRKGRGPVEARGHMRGTARWPLQLGSPRTGHVVCAPSRQGVPPLITAVTTSRRLAPPRCQRLLAWLTLAAPASDPAPGAIGCSETLPGRQGA